MAAVLRSRKGKSVQGKRRPVKPLTAPKIERQASASKSKKLREIRFIGLWICAVLFVAVLLLYSQVSGHEFVSFDDPIYVTQNPEVRGGLTWTGVAWAFTSFYGSNWFPLTWLSHMLDCQLFGLNSGWQHLTNVWIHALSTMLLFAVLRRMTGEPWRSAMVALLFGLHPLHVESVAWIAERKDVLSGFFWMLTLWAYAAYASRPGRWRLALTWLVFCLGLMAKPMLVTLPFVMMLLDDWPLGRGFRILGKLPFFAASVGSSIVTYLAHAKGGAVASVEWVPLSMRCENALISCAVYILKTFWPTRLAVFYPYPLGSLLLPALFAGVALAAITALALLWHRQRPYLTVGWLWYLVTLLPVIGLIQTGEQARADRYTYIPMIGLTMALVWGISQALQPWPRFRVALAVAVVSICGVLTWVQLQFWRDDLSLYEHAIDVVPDNYLARFNLASALEARGRSPEAIAQLRETVRLRPSYIGARAELGQLLAKQGQIDEGLQDLETAVRMRPDDADAHFRLGSVLGMLGRNSEAAEEFSQTIRLQPENADAHYNLGIALAQQDKVQQAAREFTTTVQLRPDDAEARLNLGIALARLGRIDDAIHQFSEALRINPDFSEARQALAQAMSLKQAPGIR
jgi:protein O-mannosyl-transferase